MNLDKLDGLFIFALSDRIVLQKYSGRIMHPPNTRETESDILSTVSFIFSRNNLFDIFRNWPIH
jgi:hypothetical protein